MLSVCGWCGKDGPDGIGSEVTGFKKVRFAKRLPRMRDMGSQARVRLALSPIGFRRNEYASFRRLCRHE